MLFALASCKTGSVREDQPALIVEATPASRAEIQRVVSSALNVSKVTIADDALMRDSLLIIEPAQLMGRDLRRPEHFHLVLNGSTCVLVYRRTDARYELEATRCRAEETRDRF